MLLQALRDETSEPVFEDSGVEVLGSRDGCGRIEAHGLESIEGLDKAVRRLLVEEGPCNPLDDGFGRSAAPERDNRPAARHGFDRDHAEVLFARKDQSAATRV